MPIDFDPEWEYWEPDPEIAEILREASQVRSAKEYLYGGSFDDDQGRPYGMTFGSSSGGSFWCCTHLARERVSVKNGYSYGGRNRTLPDVRCPTCQGVFVPSESTDKYCSRECVPRSARSGGPRTLADIVCMGCSVVFRPKASRQKYCSLPCYYRTRPKRGKNKMRSMRDIFRSYAVFDAEGRHVNGTDKQSNHNYGDAYESLFPDRAAVELVLEVGVADGSCLLAWREAFPSATIVGMDIHHSDRARGERIEFHLGNQCVQADCNRVVAGRQFDLIVEDATHRLEDTLRTLLFLWPYVRPGGLYVVEEWDNVGGMRRNIAALWPCAEVIDTAGPFGGVEPLVVFRKPMYVRCPKFPKGEQCALEAGHDGRCMWDRGD